MKDNYMTKKKIYRKFRQLKAKQVFGNELEEILQSINPELMQ